MKIGILNAGNLGSRLARAWVAAGHELVIAKDGEDRKIAPLLAELGDKARLGTIREAAEFGDAVLFSVYWPRVEAIVAEVGGALDGKVVIETMNPLGVTADFVHFHDLEFMRDSSTTEYLQRRLPKARIVKAFNLMAAPALEAAAWSASPLQPNIFYVTDDVTAGEVTRGLIGDAGFKPVNSGPLNGARQLEQVGVLLHHIADHEYGGDADLIRLALTVVEASPGPIVRERVA
ncbi:NADPH-dependent F420 reductase [Rhizobium laguerreae]|uniref:NADPH-dependent F420 reductase n=1 Tax=Rhizobium laguerreae TaxID=1076926 RepID=UPI001C90F467|nr:NAD(P)-binding domain-containing protein [Rhizobium laguerreae]MBY3348058.1 NAD(P)-binding domain-containing protein [Rhizobium laguerreae]MBY3355022.1 NAD(P)-binding domain-containing protein [Rhizobium laguerreae]MBY3376326.1 NAD(P)-binding domain-containing protein [Rhizobium laguerreae]MBY3431324.1 NAD(P)-binding domain-containing protein [Rhizobium laguerreae]MBY3439939.1 NAD(P)-binding domain-containing protein [Rhizobium laguerreae]